MTGTIWISDDDPPRYPLPGQKLKISHFTNAKAYQNECCQFTTRFQYLHFEADESQNPAQLNLVADGTKIGTTAATTPTNSSSEGNATTDTVNLLDCDATPPNPKETMKLEPEQKKRKTK
ncbi:hypothetical protein DVH05_010129 [Phytophthora capsici]|nr:hypothetical protein DVH05_010129 [Phytophthora capsici]